MLERRFFWVKYEDADSEWEPAELDKDGWWFIGIDVCTFEPFAVGPEIIAPGTIIATAEAQPHSSETR